MRAKTGPTAPAMVVLPPLPCPPEAAADGYSQPPPAPRQGDPCSATASCPVTRGWPPPTAGRLEGRVAQEQNIPGEVFLPLRDAIQSAEPSGDILWQTRHRFIAVIHWAGGKVVKKVFVHFPFLLEWGWIFSRETKAPILQTAIHAHTSQEQAHTQIHSG